MKFGNKLKKKTVINCALGLLVLFALFLFIPQSIFRPTQPSVKIGKYAEDIHDNVLYHVDKVIDGDTVVANVSGHEVTIRMIGINTPEVVDPRKPVECYGPEASAEGKRLLSGKEVYLERELNRESYDKYGRVLAYVHFEDGSLYNQYMVENGFAHEYTFNHEKYKYQKEFKSAQKQAQKNKLGLWGKCSTLP